MLFQIKVATERPCNLETYVVSFKLTLFIRYFQKLYATEMYKTVKIYIFRRIAVYPINLIR